MSAPVVILTGALGQDGYYLTQRLLAEGATVHALVRRAPPVLAPSATPDTNMSLGAGRVIWHEFDLLDTPRVIDLVRQTQPVELYNLGGVSSVAQSFRDPWEAWRTNADAVVVLLDALRRHSPHTRFYQASSTDMFGAPDTPDTRFTEYSALKPQSPYASAKAAAHLLCQSYRRVFGLRIACGILANHESHRRPKPFLTRKVVDYVADVAQRPASDRREVPPLRVGHLKTRRDWGFAPDYVAGIQRVLRQVQTRRQLHHTAENDTGADYRDYVLATGQTHAVWQVIDRAFALAGIALTWDLGGHDPLQWSARFADTGQLAVAVDAALIREADPPVINLDPSAAIRDLGWQPRTGLDTFLQDMLRHMTHLASSRPTLS